MCKILVIDQDFRPLNPIHPARARQMLRNKKAAIFRRFPFTLILKKSHPEFPEISGTLVFKLEMQ